MLHLHLPAGWYLNELMNRAGDNSQAIAVSWSNPAPPVDIDFKPVGQDAWSITLVKSSPDVPLLGRFKLNVSYQLCTDTECRDQASKLVEVQLR